MKSRFCLEHLNRNFVTACDYGVYAAVALVVDGAYAVAFCAVLGGFGG